LLPNLHALIASSKIGFSSTEKADHYYQMADPWSRLIVYESVNIYIMVRFNITVLGIEHLCLENEPIQVALVCNPKKEKISRWPDICIGMSKVGCDAGRIRVDSMYRVLGHKKPVLNFFRAIDEKIPAVAISDI
jgi:hypothetical protein